MATREAADVVIIGGGVMGASIAFHLARGSAGRILVLEQTELCAGSTGRSVASVDLLTQHGCVAELHVTSLRAFQNCADLYGDECGWIQTGFAIFSPGKFAGALRTIAEVINAAGGKVELLSPAEYQSHDPACETSDLDVISWAGEGGHLDPVLLTTTLARAARSLGVSVRTGERVLGLCRQGDKVVGVQLASGEVAAGTVVIAAGPWTAEFLRPEGIELPLQPQRHSVAVLAGPDNASARTSVLDLINDVYARPETGGLTICGSLDVSAGWDAIQADDPCGPATLDYGMWVWERLIRRYPGLEHGGLRKGWSGPVAMSPDGQPMIGRLPLDGLYCACGFRGAGMKIAPAVGQELAGQILGDEASNRRLSDLRPTRFAEGQPMRSPYALGPLG